MQIMTLVFLCDNPERKGYLSTETEAFATQTAEVLSHRIWAQKAAKSHRHTENWRDQQHNRDKVKADNHCE